MPRAKSEWYRFEIWQDDMVVAAVESANRTEALKEAHHYAYVYAEDGPLDVREVKDA